MGLILRHMKVCCHAFGVPVPESIAVAMLADVLENVFPTKIPRPHVVGLSPGPLLHCNRGNPRISGESPFRAAIPKTASVSEKSEFTRVSARLGSGKPEISLMGGRDALPFALPFPARAIGKLGPLGIKRSEQTSADGAALGFCGYHNPISRTEHWRSGRNQGPGVPQCPRPSLR
jgi:hypothetical protein